MRIQFGRSLLVVAALGIVSAPALAEEKKATAKDPNRIICEKQEELGSRLGSKRVCMTAAEWQQKRLNERQMIDRSQTLQKGPNGGG
jgi:hypothetical protein